MVIITHHSPPPPTSHASPCKGRGNQVPLSSSTNTCTRKILIIFEEAQSSNITHRKLFNSLRKLHLQSVNSNSVKDFYRSFIETLNIVLGSKIKRPVIERLLGFTQGFISFSLIKDRELATKQLASSSSTTIEPSNDLDLNEDDFPSTLFATMLINYLLKGIDVKDKNVRYRCARLIYLISSSLPYIDEELYATLKRELSSRLRDKEPQVRKEIVLGLSTLQAGEDDQDGILVTQKLAEVAIQDPTPIVRRVALTHIILTQNNLAAVVSRCRDTDQSIRITVYKLLIVQVPDCAVLGSQYLNMLLSCGLTDPDMKVRQACIGLVHTWVKGSPMVLTKILVQLNVVTSSISEALVMECLRGTKQSGPLKLKMNPNAWRNLTPETALILRCYTLVHLENPDLQSDSDRFAAAPTIELGASSASSCQEEKFTTVDEVLVVERLAYFLQLHCNHMITNKDESLEPAYLYVVAELVQLALLADYSEPHGCGLMFTLARNMLRSQAVHEDLVDPLVRLVRMLSVDERDFIRIVHEVIVDTMDMPNEEDLQDQVNRDSTGISMEELCEEEMLFRHLKCLVILRRALEATPMAWHSDSMVPIHGLVNELVAPASKRFPNIGEVVSNALACLGLISLTSIDHAQCHALQFIEFANLPSAQRVADEDILQVCLVALASLLDIVLLYGITSLNLDESGVIDTLFSAVHDPLSSVCALAIPGCVKLCLAGRIANPRIVSSLFVHGLSGKWQVSPEIQQCLDFFMDNYASTVSNKRTVSNVFAHVLYTLHQDNGFRNTTLVIAGTKLATCIEDEEHGADLQMDVMLQLLNGSDAESIPFKPAVQLCSKWTLLNGQVQYDKVRRVQTLLTNVPAGLGDTPTHNAIAKLEATLIRILPPVHPDTAPSSSPNEHATPTSSPNRAPPATPCQTVDDQPLMNKCQVSQSKPTYFAPRFEIELPRQSTTISRIGFTPRTPLSTATPFGAATRSSDRLRRRVDECEGSPTPTKRPSVARKNLLKKSVRQNMRKRHACLSDSDGSEAGKDKNEFDHGSVSVTGSDHVALKQLAPGRVQAALGLARDLDSLLSSDDD